jgi:hypothetical protein
VKDKYFGAHEFRAREEVVKISSERGFGLVFAGFFTLLGSAAATPSTFASLPATGL